MVDIDKEGVGEYPAIKKTRFGQDSIGTFDYYQQDLRGKAEIWDHLVEGLIPDGEDPIIGNFMANGTIVWSANTKRHYDLQIAIKNTDDNARIGRLQSRWFPDSPVPELWLYTDNPALVPKVTDYFKRSIRYPEKVKFCVSINRGEIKRVIPLT